MVNTTNLNIFSLQNAVVLKMMYKTFSVCETPSLMEEEISMYSTTIFTFCSIYISTIINDLCSSWKHINKNKTNK